MRYARIFGIDINEMPFTTLLSALRELTGFFPRIDRIFPSATSKRYLKG